MATPCGLFCIDNNISGKREHVNTTPIKRNTWKCEAGSTLDEIMLDASLRIKQKGLQRPSVNWSPQKERYRIVAKAISTTEKHRSSLNSYLKKLEVDTREPSLEILNQRTESICQIDEFKAENGLRSLQNYLSKIKDTQALNYVNEEIRASTNTYAKKDEGSGKERSLKHSKPDNAGGKEGYPNEASDFYIIGILASINIAVFLFEIATPVPVKSSHFDLYSLPMVYGAKINNLILTGEWWRLVTPMFLHSGIFHISLGSWILFTFGLQVSREYGSFTFSLIYFLGGISGNIISFLHMPQPTVGGTGPVFAVIGAWLIYQVQNKAVIPKDAMVQKAIIAAALTCILSNFGPIDDWANFGATFAGIAYGFVTCPTMQVKDASSEAGQQERITLVSRYAHPCKSLIYSSIFLLLLSSLLLVIQPPHDLME